MPYFLVTSHEMGEDVGDATMVRQSRVQQGDDKDNGDDPAQLIAGLTGVIFCRLIPVDIAQY